MAINPSDLARSLQPLSAPQKVQTNQQIISVEKLTNKIESATQLLQKHLGSPGLNQKIDFFPIAMSFKEVVDHLDKANQQPNPFQFNFEGFSEHTGYDFWKALQILKKQLIAFRKTATFKNSLGPQDKELLLVFQSRIEMVAQKVSRFGVLFLETEMEMLGRYLVNGTPYLWVVNEAIDELDLAKEYLIDETIWGYWKTTLTQINQQLAELQEKEKQHYKSDFSKVHERINSIILYIQARQALLNFNEFIENYTQFFLGEPNQPSPDMNALLAKLKENTLNILRQDNLPDYLDLLQKLHDGIFDYGKKIKISDFAILKSLASTRSLIGLIEFALDSSPFFKKLTDFANEVNKGIIPPGAAINIQKELVSYQFLIESQENWLAWLNILKAIHFDLQNIKHENDKGLSSLNETLQELITKISKLHINKLPNTLESLPSDIIYSIFTSFLNRESRNALQCTSKHFNNFLNKDEKGQTKVIKEVLFKDEKSFTEKLPEISEIKKLAIEVFNAKIAKKIADRLICLDDLEIDLSKSPALLQLSPKFKLTKTTLSRIAIDHLALPHLDFVQPTVTELSLKACTFSFNLSEVLRQKIEEKVFDNLQRIILSKCGIEDDSIFEPLSNMPSLTSLRFINNGINDVISSWLPTSHSLTDLDLSYNFFFHYNNLRKIIPASTKTLTLKRLSPQEFNTRPNKLLKHFPSGEGNEAPKVTENFAEMIQHAQLTRLTLVNQPVPNSVLLTIMGMTSLQVLTHKVRTPGGFLGEGALPPMLTPALCSEMKLTTLNFSGAFHQLYTCDKVPLMEALAYSKTLTDLDVSRNSLERMPARFPPNLTRLDIYNNGIYANPGPSFVLERLKSLNISGNHLLLYSWLDGHNRFNKYHYPGIAIKLEHLNADNTGVDIAWLTAIAYIPTLRKLSLRNNSSLETKDLKLFAGHPSLTEFHFRITNELEARKFLITLPELKIFNGHDLSKKGLATVLKPKEAAIDNPALVRIE